MYSPPNRLLPLQLETIYDAAIPSHMCLCNVYLISEERVNFLNLNFLLFYHSTQMMNLFILVT